MSLGKAKVQRENWGEGAEEHTGMRKRSGWKYPGPIPTFAAYNEWGGVTLRKSLTPPFPVSLCAK